MMSEVINNDDYGTLLESGAVRFTRLLPGPIERVWEYITDSDKRATWLAAGEMELRVGGKVTLQFHNGALAPKGEPVPDRYSKYTGVVNHGGVITEYDPPRLLAMTWGTKEDPDGRCGPGVNSEVVFELTPKGKDVLMVLTHRRLTSRTEMLSVSSGWHTHVAALIDRLNGRPVQAFWMKMDKLEQYYDKAFPA